MNVTWKFFKSDLSEKEINLCNTFKSNAFGIIDGFNNEETKTIFVNLPIMRLFRDLTRTFSHEIFHLTVRKCYRRRTLKTRQYEEIITRSIEFGGFFG